MRNSLQMTSWFTWKPWARVDTIMASAQIPDSGDDDGDDILSLLKPMNVVIDMMKQWSPSGLRPVTIQSFLRRVISRSAVEITAARDSPSSSRTAYLLMSDDDDYSDDDSNDGDDVHTTNHIISSSYLAPHL